MFNIGIRLRSGGGRARAHALRPYGNTVRLSPKDALMGMARQGARRARLHRRAVDASVSEPEGKIRGGVIFKNQTRSENPRSALKQHGCQSGKGRLE